MNLDTSGTARHGLRPPGEDGMEDIDLEGGRTEKFGNVRYSDREMAKQRDEEKLAMAGLEHRRASPNLLGGNGTRSPSPNLSYGYGSRPTSPVDGYNEPTPRASTRDEIVVPHASVLAATNKLRRPPPIAALSDASVRSWTADEDRDREVIRSAGIGSGRPSSLIGSRRVEREASTTSLTSEVGLLDLNAGSSTTHSRANSPPIMFSSVQSPAQMGFHLENNGGGGSARSSVSLTGGHRPGIRLVGGKGSQRDEGMEEISLEGGR